VRYALGTEKDCRGEERPRATQPTFQTRQGEGESVVGGGNDKEKSEGRASRFRKSRHLEGLKGCQGVSDRLKYGRRSSDFGGGGGQVVGKKSLCGMKRLPGRPTRRKNAKGPLYRKEKAVTIILRREREF